MKILVCVSKVPDTTTKITFTDNNTKFNEDKVQWIVNPTDEWYALVKGLELKEKLGGNVTVINVGNAENEAIIRKALAIGADDAVRIDAPETDAYLVAAQIAEYAKSESFDIVLLGKETINYNGYMVGGVIAELLDMPYVALVTSLDVNGSTATLKREIEGAEETVEVSLPLVVSAQKGIAEARIPNMRGIMAARTKPLKVVPASNAEALTEVKMYEAPAPKQAVKLVSPDNVEQLVELLHNEAKVI
ncbi:MAG: electron transfer flavoprotein subunit beta/FixA family protein [Chitinophagales bacterium]|nr:electron transfer flavoprotein subunit beta/FixA family protein [Chitinophagales bacterium]